MGLSFYGCKDKTLVPTRLSIHVRLASPENGRKIPSMHRCTTPQVNPIAWVVSKPGPFCSTASNAFSISTRRKWVWLAWLYGGHERTPTIWNSPSLKSKGGETISQYTILYAMERPVEYSTVRCNTPQTWLPQIKAWLVKLELHTVQHHK